MTPPGSLAIDLTHTRSMERDRLTDFEALVAWSERRELVSAERARSLRDEAARHPGRAASAHATSVALRDAIDGILRARSRGESADRDDLGTLNRMLRRASEHRVLVPAGAGHEWAWRGGEDDGLEALLWPIAYDAAELLTSAWSERVGVCAADDCRWIFIDESRNRSRKWCDMSDCGTRAKVRRFRARAREGTDGE